MTTLILLKTSLAVIYRHAARSVLTILGIMIGIASIIVTFSIGRGAEQRIRSQIMALGENSLYIIPGNVIERGHVRSNLGKKPKVTMQDLYAIQEQIESVAYISPGYEVMESITYGSVTAQERIMGSDITMLQIQGKTVARGDFFNDYHIQERVNVVVLGDVLAKNLFKGEEPLGKTIHIKKVPFTVLGVLAHEDNYWGTQDPNKQGFMPYTVAKKYFKKSTKGDQDVDFIAAKLGDEKSKGEGLRKITRALRHTHHIKPGDEDDFTIFDQQSIATSAETASQIIQLFGLIAASISLLVGGIGIMNIMLVSVQERTREIGVRLALGATQSTIQAQFLIESVSLCVLGGIIGILVGLGLNFLLGALTNLPGVVEIMPLLGALVVTMLIGISFGYYPARKASLLDPVKALYYV
ncbi:TPA: hypothetical protein DDZ86_01780 [Candidatus Dependentiae bacterium]|nr:MAG: ABC-type antimicrobial peptide transport system, permease component [candidate division TM6 bacterium GW2011_GWF2_43_87]HBL98354.1 hypothetical protein [Candidatus Dependentiae bacterium]